MNIKIKFIVFVALACAVGVGGFAVPAHATVIGVTPNINFHDSSVTFGFGDAQFTLINNPNATYPLSVSTSGSAEVTVFPAGAIPNSPHQPGGVGDGESLPIYTNIFGQQSYVFDMFPNATPSPSFNFFGPYLGLKFMLNDGIHYGYAKILNTDTLVSYAYESQVGAGIVTGAAIMAAPLTAVPEPSSLGMLVLGLGLLGGLAWMSRRRASAAGRRERG